MPRLILTAPILLSFVAVLHAADKSPKQIVGGKPIVSTNGNAAFYDSHGSYVGRTNGKGSYSAHGTYSGNSMGGYYDRRPYSGQAAAAAGGVMRHYDARGRYVGSTHR